MSGNSCRDNWLSNRIFKSYEDMRAVLPSLEQPHRPTMEDHVPRHAQMGAWVLINATVGINRWLKGDLVAARGGRDAATSRQDRWHEPVALV